VDGISIPDPASIQQELIAMAGPGNRVPEGTVPGFVLKNGQPVLGFSCINSGNHNQTFTSLLDVLDFKMTPQESVDTPTIGRFEFIQDELNLFIEPDRFSDTLLTQASKLNVTFHEHREVMGGGWTGIYRNVETGKLNGTKVWLK
jgi:gamma-glutamyltranspeptidase/glutathione hydrolase